MSSASFLRDPDPGVSAGYRFVRALIRGWFALAFRKIRLLEAEVAPVSGPCLLVVSHPGSFLDALILVATFEKPLHCLLDRRLCRGPFRSLVARALGVIPYDLEGKGWRSAIQAGCEALARGKTLLVFAEPQVMEAVQPPLMARTGATIALQAESSHAGRLGLAVFPVYMFLPVKRSQSSELMVYVDAPLAPREYLPGRGEDTAGGIRKLAMALETAFRKNVFRLSASDLERFLADFADVLRTDLAEDWATRRNWKQEVEGFELSRFVAEGVEQLNYLNPGKLVALREFVDEYREARRRESLRQLEVEAGGPWLKSALWRMLVWVETGGGFPLACYGLVNHLLAWLFLFWAGLLRKETVRDERLEWLARGLVVLGCYGAQILTCAHWLGRPTAGYYALSLPVSGAYLWHYGRLWRRRTRLLLLSQRVPAQAMKLRRMRKELIDELNAVRDVYAETLGVPH